MKIKAIITGSTGKVGKGVLFECLIFKLLYPVFKALTPNSVTSTTQVGQAMMNIADKGFEKNVLTNQDINKAALP